MQKPFNEGIEFIKNGIKQKNEEDLLNLWIHVYYQKYDYIQFKNMIESKTISHSTDNRTDEEIMLEIKNLMDNVF